MSNQGKILVTGGAGYIGSHTVQLLAEQGYDVIVLDNLVYGHRQAILSSQVELVEGDVRDCQLVQTLFSQYPISAVMHFAAFTYVGESVQDPLKYYQNNVAAPLTLFKEMQEHGCRQFILSSTCATYGDPHYLPLDEKHPQLPINPYGQSKLMLENIARDCERAFGLQSVFLRYFNASGASLDGRIGEDHDPETHLIPLVLRAAKEEGESITVHGTDYPTPDGTCIRDYVHVVDLARAHVAALTYLRDGGQTIGLNLGTGQGVSVKQIIEKAEGITGKSIAVQYGERRPGDPPQLVADPALAKEVLGWEAEYKEVDTAIETAWQWMEKKGKYSA